MQTKRTHEGKGKEKEEKEENKKDSPPDFPCSPLIVVPAEEITAKCGNQTSNSPVVFTWPKLPEGDELIHHATLVS